MPAYYLRVCVYNGGISTQNFKTQINFTRFALNKKRETYVYEIIGQAVTKQI